MEFDGIPYDNNYNFVIRNWKKIQKLPIDKARTFIESNIAEYLAATQDKIDGLLSIPKVIKSIEDKKIQTRVFQLLRRYINLTRESMRNYGYYVVEILGRSQINQYIKLMQKAGLKVNQIKPKINIVELHKKVYGFMDSLDVKLVNPKLWATSSRVTILKSAKSEVRNSITSMFDSGVKEFFGKNWKRVFPYDMESVSLEKQTEVLVEKLRRLGYGEKINISNSSVKTRFVSLKDYCETWASDTVTRAQFLTTTHLCDAMNSDLVKIIAAPTACDDCQSLAGIYSLNPNNEKYEYLAIEPPFHPRCTCQTVPYSEDFEKIMDDMLIYSER